MTKFLSAFLLLALQTASAQKFDCPEGSICTEFTDGCNTCNSPDGNAALAACTEMACPCYEDKSCEPSCLDNEECVWIEESNPGLFECPEGTVCTEFTDGCNSCTTTDGDTSMAGCTEMWCTCYEDNSCVPKCTDNELCVPVGTTAAATTEGSCTPSDDTMCPVAGCLPPTDSDCQYQEGEYMLDGEGNCCREQCVFVNSQGERCDFDEDMGATTEEDATTSVTNTAEDTGACTPSKDAPCPVVDCMTPSDPDCTYQEGDYFLDAEGNCCREQCVFVHSNGERCELEEDAGATADDEKVADTGAECTPRGDEACPVARCSAAPEGCEYVFDHYVMFENNKCCPSLCYAVDSEGNECPFEPSGEDHGEDHDHTAEDHDNNLKPGDMCTPNKDMGAATAMTKQATGPEAEKCPVAGCAAPPEGCEYKMDHYVINAVGDCCPELCYAVDSDGNDCVGISESSSTKHSLWLGSSLFAAVLVLMAKN